MNPMKLEGSRYSVIRIRNQGGYFTPNGDFEKVESLHYYAGTCVEFMDPDQVKALAVTTPGTGFQDVVAGPLLTVFNAGYWNQGIFAKWLDVVTDPDVQVGTLKPQVNNAGAFAAPVKTAIGNGRVGTGPIATSTRLPLTDHVTVRKHTNVAGKNWAKGRWKFTGVDESFTDADEINNTGYTAWAVTPASPTSAPAISVKEALYQPLIGLDPASLLTFTLYPIVVSFELSQLRRNPTRICYAQMKMPGFDYINNTTDAVINSTLGHQEKREEKKPHTTF